MANIDKIILNGTQYDLPSGGSSYTAGEGIDITNDVISANTDNQNEVIASALVELHNDKADRTQLNNYQPKGNYTTQSQVDATVQSYARSETEAISVEKVDAAALNDLNERVTELEQGGGGGGISGITMNGSSVTVTSGVADLGTVVTDKSDKQDVIDSTHKLSADLVDDTSTTNKFVTATDKTTWSGKQDALVSGTNIKTINNESILGSGNITIGGGGGNTIAAGTNISVTTSGTTDTVNCTLPITAGTNGGIIVGDNECTSTGEYSIALGHNSDVSGGYSMCMGSNSSIETSQFSLVVGDAIKFGNGSSHSIYVGTGNGLFRPYTKQHTHGFGVRLSLDNIYETSFGIHNKPCGTMSQSIDFGSPNSTLFTIGNGYDYTSTHNYHNAFEVRQNGDIYIPDTDDTSDPSQTAYSTYPMVRLQDYITTVKNLSDTVTALAARVTALESRLNDFDDSGRTVENYVYGKFDDVRTGLATTNANLISFGDSVVNNAESFMDCDSTATQNALMELGWTPSN